MLYGILAKMAKLELENFFHFARRAVPYIPLVGPVLELHRIRHCLDQGFQTLHEDLQHFAKQRSARENRDQPSILTHE